MSHEAKEAQDRPGWDRLDPEFVGLLHELKGQDGRQLLSGLSSWRKPKHLSAEDQLRPGSPFLSRLERHLLTVFRDQLGELMQEACLDLLLHEPAFGGSVIPNRDEQGRPILPRAQGERRADLDHMESMLEGERQLSSDLSLLKELLGAQPARTPVGRARRSPQLLIFALAGYRIRPSDAMEIYIARGFEADNAPEEAIRRLKAVIEGPSRYKNRIVAADNLSGILWDLGRRSEALGWAEWASTGKLLRSTAAASWATFACLAQDQEHIEKSLRVLASRYDPQDPVILQHCERLRRERQDGQWNPCVPPHRFSLPTGNLDYEHIRQIRTLFE